MKKILTLILCAGTLMSVNAQSSLVKEANDKLKKKNYTEARAIIQEAIAQDSQNPEVFFTAGKIEMDSYDNGKKAKGFDPNVPSGDNDVLGNELLSAYKYFSQAIPLAVTDQKIRKEISKSLSNHYEDFFNIGGGFYQNKKYYPEAYQAFMIYGDLPEQGLLEKNIVVMPEQLATSFFNAGLAAYSGNAVDESADAFKKARLAGYDQPESYIYEIACWQYIAQNDESRAKEAQDNITVIAEVGNDKFGLEQPVFLNNLINNYVINGDFDQALAKLNPIIDANPENPALYGLRGFVFDRMGNDDNSEADYRKAASFPDTDFETLKNISKKLFLIGTSKLNNVEGTSPEAIAERENIKVNYFQAAKSIAEKAAQTNPNDSDLNHVLDSIDYALTTYFN